MTAPEPQPQRREPPDDDAPPKPLMSAGFWLALAFGAACVLAGAAVAVLGARGAL